MKITKESFAQKIFTQDNFQDKMLAWLKNRQNKYNFEINYVGDKSDANPGIDLTFNCDNYNVQFDYNMKTGKVNFQANIKYNESMRNFFEFLICLNKMINNIKGFLTELEKIQ